MHNDVSDVDDVEKYKKNVRRQNLRRQRSVVPAPLAEEIDSVNYDTSVGNNIADNIDPQILDLEMETINRTSENTNLEIASNNLPSNLNTIFCNGSKSDRASILFSGRANGKPYKQCSSCRLRNNTRRHPQALSENNTYLPTLDFDSVTKYCTMCKKNCSSTLFTSNSRNSPYDTCSYCRALERSRRLPPIFSTRSTALDTMYPLGKLFHISVILLNFNHYIGREEDIYDVNDNENGNMGAQVRRSSSQEVVGEEAMADDEPVIILSHTDSREYAAHMRAREALPENHDDLFDNLNIENLDHENINSVEIVDDVVTTENGGNSNRLNEDNMHIDNDNGGNEINSETTAPRRLPQWLAPLPTHRRIPAAYTSQYNRNLPTHNLGRCTSVCPSCHALHWPQERVHSSSIARPRFQTCCKEGQVVLNEMPEPPAYLRWLWTSEDRDAKEFRKNSRQYNRAFAFTSFKYTEDRRLADRGIHGGLRSFSIHGQIYHQTGAAMREGAVPRYAQLYFVGSERAVEARTEGNNLNPDIVRSLTELIEQNNPFVEYYHTALRSLQESEQ
ncbi:hypothetical protein EPUL_004448, partial [Erysiphe pulchra]